MNVSGIRPYEGFYKYNSIKMSQLRSEQLEAEAEAARVVEEMRQRELQSETPKRTKQNMGAADYAKTYQPAALEDRKSANSSLNSLDVEQVVSDLEKDQILKQYQFFVGKNPSQNKSENAGANPRGMENFNV